MTLIGPHIAAFLQQRLPIERRARTLATPTRMRSNFCFSTPARA